MSQTLQRGVLQFATTQYDGQMVDIQTCFPVPLEQQNGIVLDKDYNQKMLKFHRKVNPKEDLIGLYISGN